MDGVERTVDDDCRMSMEDFLTLQGSTINKSQRRIRVNPFPYTLTSKIKRDPNPRFIFCTEGTWFV
jgi:hypothetical protein